MAICTIEKANSIVNKLMEQGKLETIGMVVVDEVHHFGQGTRLYPGTSASQDPLHVPSQWTADPGDHHVGHTRECAAAAELA